MDITTSAIADLFNTFFNRIVNASSGGGRSGQTIWFRTSSQTLQGRCITDIPSGNCLALLTDQGEWILCNTQESPINQASDRNISYRQAKLNKQQANVVGILVDLKYAISSSDTSSPSFYFPDSGKYNSSVSLTDASDFYWQYVNTLNFGTISGAIWYNNQYTFTTPVQYAMYPLGFFVGTVNGNRAVQKFLITDIPGLNNYQPSDGTNDIFEIFNYDNYYSTIFNKNSVSYITNISTNTIYGVGDSYQPGNIINLSVLQFNTRLKRLSTTNLFFRNTTRLYHYDGGISDNYYNGVITGSVFLVTSSPPYFIRVLKYKSQADNKIYYILISGNAGIGLIGGLIIWDIGTADNLNSKNNIACYFGFEWLIGADRFGHSADTENGIRIADAYGASGGIVFLIYTPYDYFYSYVEIFVPEKFLKGETGISVNSSDLLFSVPIYIIKNQPNLVDEPLPVPVGTMPPPLEKKKLIAPYTIPSKDGYQKKLILYNQFR